MFSSPSATFLLSDNSIQVNSTAGVCVVDSDFHQKQAAKKALMRKALDKNPDEFYFKMIRTHMEVNLLFD